MLSGNILDVYPDYEKNVMVSWLLQDGKTTRVEEPYDPCFYVHTPSSDLSQVSKAVEQLPQVKRLQLTPAKLTLGSSQHTMVLEVVPKHLNALHPLADLIDSWGGFHRYQLFNVDLRLPTRYLHERNVFCHAQVTWDGRRFTCMDDQWALDYQVPRFKILRLDLASKKQGVPSFQEPLPGIRLDDEIIQEDNETDTIISVLNRIKQLDPDVIATVNGDSLLFPFLYHRAKSCGIEHLMNLGREKNQKKNNLRPVKKAKSYFSYGRIVYRPAFYTLQGRIHLDTAQSFFYGESGLHGILDIARCANIPLQLLSRLGPGTAISQIEINAAMKKGYLVPWKKNMPENWKTAEELLIADRGGLVLEPVVGLHEDVVELDYASLYPNIMVVHNISPETMLCPCCPDSSKRVPQLGYHICRKQKGLLPEVLEPILQRRFCFKARAKNNQYDPAVYTELQKAWKWVLVVCFGYTGYRNARYGRIECHESITAFSRDILLTASEVAQQAGYEVLHGIVDSLWVKGSPGCVRPFHLSRMISNRTGIRMDVEGRYKWIVFLPSKATGVGALTRYYGMFEDGKVKVRGVELRQHNTPVFLKNAQQEMLTIFKQANTAEEFRALLPTSVEVLRRFAVAIREDCVDHSELVCTTTVSKDIATYKVQTLPKSALLQLQDLGVQVQPGQSVRYLVTDETSQNYKQRVCLAEKIQVTEH
ncbi:MAG TPA: DNA polymerase domain-containing protein, partial [Candidatus Thermoplasmatota archaeon]|nr:DNA polymerase domain-containing protein [Candidatus Thermoplasmatota archaeon]